MNLVLPMAGEGSRFKEKGYNLPKPLIDVGGEPMIKKVYDCFSDINFSKYIFICRESHEEDFQISSIIKSFCPKAIVVFVKEKTEGALCTALLASLYWDKDEPLLLANSDQLIKLPNIDNFNRNLVSTFKCPEKDPKWSYCQTGENNNVLLVAEKEPISENANTGIYHFSSASLFRKYAEQMIDNNIRSKGEFYIAPVYNLMIKDGIPVYTSECESFIGLGTPEDLEKYENSKR